MRITRQLIAILLALTLAAAALIGCKAAPQADETAAGSFERGVWTENVYSNGYLGLQFTLPEGFVAASDEEIANMMELGTDILENENISDWQMKIAMLKSIYDMMASSPATGSSVLVMLENLSLTVGGSAMTEADYADFLAAQLAQTQVAGQTYAAGEAYEDNLDGERYYVQPMVLGDGLVNQNYYLRRIDGYMLIIMLSYATGMYEEGAAMKSAFDGAVGSKAV